MIRSLAGTIFLTASIAEAEPLRFPGSASLVNESVSEGAVYGLPVGIFDGASVPKQSIEGTITRQVWTLASAAQTTDQILRPFREQLRNAGYDLIFSCETRDCGGFDFRFGIEVAAPPAIFVNLADFAQLSAIRETVEGQTEAVSILASRNAERGYVQLVAVGATRQAALPANEPVGASTTAPGTLAEQLDTVGHAVLDGLSFERGSAQLGSETPNSLADVADYLIANPDIDVALVGHTDAEGALEGNITLSRRRAASVMERLASEFGIERSRMEAQGMGYLAPIASNRTEAGRDANRRVEVIITSTDP